MPALVEEPFFLLAFHSRPLNRQCAGGGGGGRKAVFLFSSLCPAQAQLSDFHYLTREEERGARGLPSMEILQLCASECLGIARTADSWSQLLQGLISWSGRGLGSRIHTPPGTSHPTECLQGTACGQSWIPFWETSPCGQCPINWTYEFMNLKEFEMFRREHWP